LLASVILIPALIAGGAVGGYLLAWNTASTFRSDAIVVPSEVRFPVAQFPVLAEAVFRTDAVIEPVISQLGLDTSPHELLKSGLLSAEEVQTGGAIDVVAVTRDPVLSQQLVNAAAQSLVQAMQGNNLGSASVFTADAPGEELTKPVVAYTIAGAVVGLLVALGLILAVKALGALRASLRASREPSPE
jgi:hypothetical protein